MAIQFLMSGGNFAANNINGPGIWLSSNALSVTQSPPSGRSSFAYQNSGAYGNGNATTPLLGAFTGMIAGFAQYLGSNFKSGDVIFEFLGSTGQVQTSVSLDVFGHLVAKNNAGTVLGTSTVALTPSTWSYIEFKTLFSLAASGTVEIRVNSSVVLSVSGVITAVTLALGCSVLFGFGNASGPGNVCYATDFYILDTVSGANTTYLGDIRVQEVYPNAAGINSNWVPAVNLNPFTGVITTVSNGSGSSAIYTGTMSNTTTNAYVNYYINTLGFLNANNNQIAAYCTASNATALVLTVSGTITPETNTASAVASPPFALTNVNAATNVFTGYIPGGASNAYLGYNFNVLGFTNSSNNVVGATCTASNVTAITLSATGLVTENHATPVAQASFQNLLQIGINLNGTRPNGDAVYFYDSNPGDRNDWASQRISQQGVILGVQHISYLRKDASGARTAAQYVNSSSTMQIGPSNSLGASYQYWKTIIENDPATLTQWTVNGINNAKWGVQVVS